MTDTTNPYAAPEFSEASAAAAAEGRMSRRSDSFALIAWPIVFGLNLIFPLMLARSVAESHAQFGMVAACALYLFLGWLLCLAKPSLARRLIIGGMVIALTQFFPILQFIAGILVVDLASSLGLPIDDDAVGQTRGELAGFFVTFLVGGMLIACAGLAGLVAGKVLPKRWLGEAQPSEIR